MDVARIFHELTFYERLPLEAIRAANAGRQAVLPVFMEEIERYLAANADDRTKPNPLFFIFHLLGSWRVKSAYRPLTRLLRSPRDEIDGILGDGITSTSHRVMAAVFDGDPQPLYDVILDPAVDEYIRSRTCEALAMVTLRGEMPREEATRFLFTCYSDLKPEHDCFVWNGWQSAIAMLGLDELKSLVERAFERESIDRSWLDFEHFERDLRHAIEHHGSLPYTEDREYTLFGDTIEELSSWYGFSPKYEKDKERRARAAAKQESQMVSAVSPFKGVGRNDPCPCGSGKKFKKCCLNVLADRNVGDEVEEARSVLSWR
jgi:hypothetical protein